MTKFTGRGPAIITGKRAYARLMNDIFVKPVETMIFDTGTVYGSRYYTVEPVGGNWLEMEAWCDSTFGECTNRIWGETKTPHPEQRWYANNRKFWFRNERDRTMFVLKWSGT